MFDSNVMIEIAHITFEAEITTSPDSHGFCNVMLSNGQIVMLHKQFVTPKDEKAITVLMAD